MVDLSAQTVLEVQDKSEKEAENPRVSSVEVFPRERDGNGGFRGNQAAQGRIQRDGVSGKLLKAER